MLSICLTYTLLVLYKVGYAIYLYILSIYNAYIVLYTYNSIKREAALGICIGLAYAPINKPFDYRNIFLFTSR